MGMELYREPPDGPNNGISVGVRFWGRGAPDLLCLLPVLVDAVFHRDRDCWAVGFQGYLAAGNREVGRGG